MRTYQMTRVRASGEAVRTFIIEHLDEHPRDIVKVAAARFGRSRQAIHQHLQRLIAEGAVIAEGKTRAKNYRLASLLEWQETFDLEAGLTEAQVWRRSVAPQLGNLPENVVDIWQYGVTEIFNNAIDHSAGKTATIHVRRTAASSTLFIYDDGVGIFKKIAEALGLDDPRHAVLELAKGKFTTDPAHHSGEGIFFTSRLFDKFGILSGGVYFSHEIDEMEDWILQADSTPGTVVQMQLSNHTARRATKVFDKFSSGDDYGFTKTVVPVKLLQYGDDNLISRSQAKRLLARFDRFRTVMLDFTGVAMVGQAFADEIFRVFRLQHPEIELLPIHANSAVKRMIARAYAGPILNGS
jgi:anti-sigma regulatory factor (Ser/Thr protein kinase)